MMATGYRGIATRYLRGQTRPYGWASCEPETSCMPARARHKPRPREGFRLSNERFDHVWPVHGGEREATTATNSVTTCVVLGGGRIRVPGVRRQHCGITSLPRL